MVVKPQRGFPARLSTCFQRMGIEVLGESGDFSVFHLDHHSERKIEPGSRGSMNRSELAFGEGRWSRTRLETKRYLTLADGRDAASTSLANIGWSNAAPWLQRIVEDPVLGEDGSNHIGIGLFPSTHDGLARLAMASWHSLHYRNADRLFLLETDDAALTRCFQPNAKRRPYNFANASQPDASMTRFRAIAIHPMAAPSRTAPTRHHSNYRRYGRSGCGSLRGCPDCPWDRDGSATIRARKSTSSPRYS